METAKPAGSSAGEVIWEPDDKRCRDWLKAAEDCISCEAAFCADMFVLMTITNSFRESPPGGAFDLHDIHVAGRPFNGRPAVVPRQLLEAADRLSCDTTLIGTILPRLNFPFKKFRVRHGQIFTLAPNSVCATVPNEARRTTPSP